MKNSIELSQNRFALFVSHRERSKYLEIYFSQKQVFHRIMLSCHAIDSEYFLPLHNSMNQFHSVLYLFNYLAKMSASYYRILVSLKRTLFFDLMENNIYCCSYISHLS